MLPVTTRPNAKTPHPSLHKNNMHSPQMVNSPRALAYDTDPIGHPPRSPAAETSTELALGGVGLGTNLGSKGRSNRHWGAEGRPISLGPMVRTCLLILLSRLIAFWCIIAFSKGEAKFFHYRCLIPVLLLSVVQVACWVLMQRTFCYFRACPIGGALLPSSAPRATRPPALAVCLYLPRFYSLGPTTHGV